MDEENDLIILNSHFQNCINVEGNVRINILNLFFIWVNKGLMCIDQQFKLFVDI